MEVFEPYSRIARLLGKYLSNELTPEEERELTAWIGEGEDNKHLFLQVTEPAFIRRIRGKNDPAGKEAAYRKFRRRVVTGRRMRIIRRLTAVAAVIVLPLTVVWLWLSPQNDTPVSSGTEIIEPGKPQAELILADGSVRQLGSHSADTIYGKQGESIFVDTNRLRYAAEPPATSRVSYNCLRIPQGGEYLVTLSDGTKIKLNARSELKYPVVFSGNRRQVYLSGEAYFEVAKDSLHPFVVHAGKAKIEVLGTAFDVRDYPEDDEMLTTLEQGKVRFVAGEQQVVLHPGQQSVLRRDGNVQVREVDTPFYTAWKDGIFAFRDERLEDIMKVMARWYDIQVFWTHASCKDVVFTGKMYRYDDFSKILDLLGLASDVRFTVKGRAISVSEK